MANTAIEVLGLKETVSALRDLGRRDATRIVRKGLRAGGKVIQSAERAEAPHRSGGVERSIGVTGAKRAGRGIVALRVGPRHKAAAYQKRNYFYAAPLIHGHVVGKHGRQVAGNDFPGRAFDSSAARAVDAATAAIVEQITAAWRG